MAPQHEKIALFIDGANLYATAKALGFDIDYKRLLREFHSRGYLMRAFYYTAVIEDQGRSRYQASRNCSVSDRVWRCGASFRVRRSAMKLTGKMYQA